VEGQTTRNPIVDGPGKYFLKVTDPYGCSDEDSVMVNFYTQATRDTIETKINITLDYNVLANDIPRENLDPSSLRIVDPPRNGIATVSADSVISYQPNPYFVGSDAFVYSICDYFQHCDQASVLVLVNDQELFIPEAFSPNGDGINDKFEIKGIAKYKRVEIEVFNRWGNIVFQSKNYGVGQGKEGFWDGTAKSGLRIGSGPVPSGTYFYILKLDNLQRLNGSIYLDR
jgi:gliding motility-associated-like protein